MSNPDPVPAESCLVNKLDELERTVHELEHTFPLPRQRTESSSSTHIRIRAYAEALRALQEAASLKDRELCDLESERDSLISSYQLSELRGQRLRNQLTIGNTENGVLRGQQVALEGEIQALRAENDVLRDRQDALGDENQDLRAEITSLHVVTGLYNAKTAALHLVADSHRAKIAELIAEDGSRRGLEDAYARRTEVSESDSARLADALKAAQVHQTTTELQLGAVSRQLSALRNSRSLKAARHVSMATGRPWTAIALIYTLPRLLIRERPRKSLHDVIKQSEKHETA